MKTLIKAFLGLGVVLASLNMANAQTSKNEKKAKKLAALKSMVDKGNFVFEANYAIPMHGPSKELNDVYDLRVTKDSIIAYLPYYGRAYTAPSPSEAMEGGIKFTSTDFNYSNDQHKNGSWNIVIKPKDGNISFWRDVQQLRLSISPDGYASLQVTSSNRDPISFDGNIVAKD